MEFADRCACLQRQLLPILISHPCRKNQTQPGTLDPNSYIMILKSITITLRMKIKSSFQLPSGGSERVQSTSKVFSPPFFLLTLLLMELLGFSLCMLHLRHLFYPLPSTTDPVALLTDYGGLIVFTVI